MSKLSHEQAVSILRKSDKLPELTRAVGTLADDANTRPDELLPALDHVGYVAEQAAIALHRMTNTPWPEERQPATSRGFWEARLSPAMARLFRKCLEKEIRDVVQLLAGAAVRNDVRRDVAGAGKGESGGDLGDDSLGGLAAETPADHRREHAQPKPPARPGAKPGRTRRATRTAELDDLVAMALLRMLRSWSYLPHGTRLELIQDVTRIARHYEHRRRRLPAWLKELVAELVRAQGALRHA